MPRNKDSGFYAKAKAIENLEDKAVFLARGDVDALVSFHVQSLKNVIGDVCGRVARESPNLSRDNVLAASVERLAPSSAFLRTCVAGIATNDAEYFEEIARALREQAGRPKIALGKTGASRQLAHDIVLFALAMEHQKTPLRFSELCSHLQSSGQYVSADDESGRRQVRRVAKEIGISFVAERPGRRPGQTNSIQHRTGRR